MNIGIEVDGVLCNNKKNKTKYTLRQCIFSSARKHASWVMRRLHNEGNKIIIITSRNHVKKIGFRGVVFRFITKNWLNRHHLYYDEIVFCSGEASSVNKKAVCEEYAIDFMIEDKSEDVVELSKGMKVICFYSNHNEIENENIIKVNTFKDIYNCMNYHDWESV